MATALLNISLNLFFITGLTVIATGLGRILLCRGDIKIRSFSECTVFSTGLGFGILSYAVFFLGTFQLLYPLAVSALLGLCAVLSIGGWFAAKCPVAGHEKGAENRNSAVWNKLFGAVLVIFLFMGLMLVMTPDVGKDALIYHLAVPKLFLRHGGFYFIEGNVFAHYPLNGEMLYTMVLGLFGAVTAKGLHFVMALAVLFGMRQFMRHHIPQMAFWPLALLIMYSIPTVFMISHVAYNDLTVTLYSFLAVYAMANWYQRKRKRWLVWCGVFSGLALSTKYTALFLPFLGCLGVLWGCRENKKNAGEAVGLLTVYLACTAIVGCPFYVKNWMMTGNAFYPFLYGLFDGKGWDPEQARLYDLFVQSLGMGRGVLDYLLLPWNLSFNAKLHSPQFDGLLGPIFILTLPFALAMRNVARGARIGLVYALFTFLFWASAAQQMRYLVPIFPFLAIMTAYVVSDYRPRKFMFGLLIIFVAGSLGLNGYHVVKHVLKKRPVGVVLGMEDQKSFLQRTLPSYDMFHYVNHELPRDVKIFLIYMKNYGYLCDRTYYSDSMFESYTIQKVLVQAKKAKKVHRVLKERGFTHILYDENYIFGPLSTLSPQEQALFSDFQKTYLELVKCDKGHYYLYRLD